MTHHRDELSNNIDTRYVIDLDERIDYSPFTLQKLSNEQVSKLSYVGILASKASNSAERWNGTSSCYVILAKLHFFRVIIIEQSLRELGTQAAWKLRCLSYRLSIKFAAVPQAGNDKANKERRNVKEVPSRIKNFRFWPVLFLGTVRFEVSRIITESRRTQFSVVEAQTSSEPRCHKGPRNGKLVGIVSLSKYHRGNFHDAASPLAANDAGTKRLLGSRSTRPW